MKPAKAPSAKMLNAIVERFIELNVPDHALHPMDVGMLACGDALLIVRESKQICKCCNKPFVEYWIRKPTKLPLRKLFKK